MANLNIYIFLTKIFLKGVKLENIMLTEGSQTQKATYFMILFMKCPAKANQLREKGL